MTWHCCDTPERQDVLILFVTVEGTTYLGYFKPPFECGREGAFYRLNTNNAVSPRYVQCWSYTEILFIEDDSDAT